MRAHARHDSIDHAPNDFGRVLERFIHSELDVLSAKEQRIAAQHRHRRLTRDPRPRAPLGEDERSSLAAKALADGAGTARFAHPGAVEDLEAEGRAQEVCDLLGREVGEGEEVRRVLGPRHPEVFQGRRRGRRAPTAALTRGR